VTRVKICGITNADDAHMAADAGAWAVGLIFAASERRADMTEAARVGTELHRKVEVAGVFANAALDEVAEIADLCSLTIVQLHGDEGPAYCVEVARRTGAKVIKAVRARDKQSIRSLAAYRDRVDFHMIDAYSPDKLGGTGETFAWELVGERLHSELPLILSGGITPDNAAEAVRRVQPFAVDSASGTESAPGRKDPAKVAALIRAVEHASQAAV
jgi:phosphoribosylanthranilate isomerase